MFLGIYNQRGGTRIRDIESKAKPRCNIFETNVYFNLISIYSRVHKNSNLHKRLRFAYINTKRLQ